MPKEVEKNNQENSGNGDNGSNNADEKNAVEKEKKEVKEGEQPQKQDAPQESGKNQEEREKEEKDEQEEKKEQEKEKKKENEEKEAQEQEREEQERERNLKEQSVIYQKKKEEEEAQSRKAEEEAERRRKEQEQREEEKKKKEEEAKKKEEEQKSEEKKKKEKEKEQQELSERLKKIDKQVGISGDEKDLTRHREKVDEMHKGMDKVDPNYIRSSAAFKYIRGSMEEVDRLSKEMSVPASARELRKYANAYKTLAEDTDNYIDQKRGEKNKSKIARQRLNYVKGQKAFAETNRDYWMEQYHETMKVKSLDEESLADNAKNVSDFLDDLGDVDPFYKKSSKEFKQVKDCLKDLKKLSEKMGEDPSEADMRKYVLATKRLNKACENYDKYKADPTDSLGVRRKDFVADLKDFSERNGADFEALGVAKGYQFAFSEEELSLDNELALDSEKTAQTEKETRNEEVEKELENLEEEEVLEEDVDLDLEKKELDEQTLDQKLESLDGQKDDFEEIEGIKSEDFWDREYGEMAKIKGIDKDSLTQNVQMLKELSDDIDKLDGRIFRAPEDFRKMKKAAKELKELGEQMADPEKGEPTEEQLENYMNKGLELSDAANAFIDSDATRKNLEKNDKDTVKRVDCATKVRECMRLNVKSVGDLQEDMKKEAEAELEAQKEVETKDEQTIEKEKEAAAYSKKNDLGNEDYKKLYIGDKDVRQMNNPHQYAVTTNGIQALGEMYMMASGDYTVEQIVDANQLKEEKTKAGMEVMKHISGGTEEDQMWLAATIYKGQTNGLKMMDEYASQFNLADPTFPQSEECANLGHMCQTMNESIKAMDNCKEQYVTMAKEMDDKKLNFNAHRQELKNELFLPNTLTTAARRMHDNVVKSERNPEDNFAKSSVLENAAVLKTTRDLIAEAQNKDQDAPMSGLLKNKEEANRAREIVSAVRDNGQMEDFISEMPKDQQAYDKSLGNIVSGKLFDGVKVSEADGVVKVSNIPSMQSVKEEQVYAKMSGVKLDRLVQEQNRKTDKLLASDKIDNPNQIDVLERAKDSREKLAKLGKKEGALSEAEMKQAKGYMKDIVAEKFLTYAVNHGIALNPEATDYTSGVDKIPAFNKETANISQGSIKKFLAEDRGTEMIKETIVEQKQALDEQKALEAERLLQNAPEKEEQVLEGGQKNPQIETPKLKAPMDNPPQAAGGPML